MAELGTVNEVVGSNVWEELEIRLPKDLEAAAKLMKETAKTFKDNALSFSFSGNLKQEIENTKELIRIQQNLAQTYRDSAKAEQEAARTRQANANAIAAEERANQAAIRTRQAATREQNANNQATQRSIQANSMHATSLAALSRNLEGLRRGYNLLTEEERKNADIGGVLLARIRELDIQLKASDASMGRYNRNVGNYVGGFGGLNMAIQQIIREGPAAAISIQTFFLAISNNLPILFDEINKVRQATTATKALGKAAYDAAFQKAIDAGQTKAQAKAAGNLAAALAIATEEEIAAANAARFQAEAAAAAAGATEAQVKAAGDLAAAQSLSNAQAIRMPGLWAQIGKSIFSINTLLTLAVLGLTLYGGKIIDMIKGVTEESKELKKYHDELAQASLTAQQSAQKEIVTMNILVGVAQDASQAMNERLDAVKKLQDTYPDYFGNLSKEKILYGDLSEEVDKLTVALYHKGIADAYAAQAATAADQFVKQKIALDKATRAAADYYAQNEKAINQQKEQAALTASQATNARSAGITQTAQLSKFLTLEKARETALKGVLSAQKEILGFQQQAVKEAEQAGGLFVDPGKDKKERVKATKDEVNEIVAALKELNEVEYDLLIQRLNMTVDNNKLILDNDKANSQNRAIALGEYYNARTSIILANQEKELKNINDFEAQYKADYDKALTTEESARTEHQNKLIIQWQTFEEKRHAITEKATYDIAQLQIEAFNHVNKLAVDEDKLRRDIGEQGVQASQRYNKQIEKYNDDFYKNKGKQRKKDLKEEKEYYQAAFSIGSSFLSAIAGIADANNQKAKDQTEERKTAIDEQADQAITIAKESGKTQAEIDKDIADIEAKRDADKRKADDDQAKRDLKNARLQKEIAIMAIILNTARSVTAALTSIPPNVPLAIANGIEGAAQLAVAIATPLPKYAKGTQNHRGGPFIGGDGGEPEWVQPKGKSGYWTPSVSTLFNEPAGTTVTPLSKIQTAVHQQAIIDIGNNIVTPELYASYFIGSFDKLTGKMDDVNRTIKSKPTILITGTDKGIGAVGRKSNAFTKYLNKNIYQ